MYNDEAVKLAWEGAATKTGTNDFMDGFTVYSASKTEAEKACWKFVEEEKPSFELSTVLPNTNFGPVFDKAMPASTGAWAGQILKGEGAQLASLVTPRKSLNPPSPSTSICQNLSCNDSISHCQFDDVASEYFVDVRDTARLHVAALINPSVKSERIFAFAEPYNWTAMFSILRKAYPDHADKIPGDIPNEPKDLSTVKTKARSEELLRAFGQDGFISLEESLKANAQTYL